MSRRELTLNGQIISKTGVIDLKSSTDDVVFNAVVSAEKNSASITAFAKIKSFSGGVSRIQVTSSGSGYERTSALVVVLSSDETVNPLTGEITSGPAAPVFTRPDFRRATARVSLDDAGRVTGVEIVDPGRGYATSDVVRAEVLDLRSNPLGGGASIVPYVDPAVQTLEAFGDVTVMAGDDLEVIGIVRSLAGDVYLESTTGNIALSANDAVIQAITGSIDVTAIAGVAVVRQASAAGDVTIAGTLGVEIIRAIESETGKITIGSDLGNVDLDSITATGGVRILAKDGAVQITSGTGVINTPETLRAGGDITIKSLGTVELANSIVSDKGDISVESEAARMTLNAVIKANGGDVSLKSASDLDDVGGGLTRIDMVNFGSSYSGQTTVRVAAPRNGGDAARVRPVIENGRITALEVIYPGKGYEPGEVVVLLGDDVFIDFPEGSSDERGRGAEAVAFCDSPTQSIEAKGSITVETRDDLKIFGVLRAEGEDGITLKSLVGDVDLIGANRTSTVADATNGSITVLASAGAARVNDLLALNAVVVAAEQDITAIGLVRAMVDSVRLETTSGDVAVQGDGKLHAVVGSVVVLARRGEAKVQNLFSGQDITLEALGDVKLTEVVNAVAGDLTIVTKAGIDNAGTVETGGTIALSASLGVTSLGGGITRIDLLSGGANYAYAIVTISGPASGGGRAATARATIGDDGAISAITIIDPGYGYASGEQVRVDIIGQPARPVQGGDPLPAGEGARAVAAASVISSSLIAGESISVKAGTIADFTNELRAKTGGVSIDVEAGPLRISEIYAAQDVGLTASQTISLGGLLRTAGGDVAIESTGGSLDMRGIIRAPAGKVEITTAGEVVQRGGSISRDKIYLLSGGTGYTTAQVVVDPPPGAGAVALARAVITDPNPFDDDATGYISEIILLDPGWGYPSDSRINVRIIGEGGTGAAAVFGTDVISSTIEANGDVSIQSGDAITLVSTVRSATGDVGIGATLGDVSIESVTAGKSVDVTSSRGGVKLVTVAATQDATITADQGVLISDSLNTTTGNITIQTTNGDITFVKELAFVSDYIVDDTIGAIEPEAVISTKAGDITITAHNGSIVTPYVINARGDVTLASLRAMELENQITSQDGDITVESTSSLVRVRSNMVAETGSITVKAQTTLQQEFVSGVSKIELLSSGPSQRVPPAVNVSVAAPRNGGEAATAYAIIEKRELDGNENNEGGDPFNKVIEYEYFIGYIAIINPGYGYDVGENPLVTITGVDGATARAYGPSLVGMITAQENVNLLAGENIKLITKIHAVDGTVTVASKTGDLDLTADSLFLSSKAGGVDIDAFGGSVDLQRAAAFGNVTVNAMEGINVLRSVMSENAGIVIASTNNAVNVRQLNAKGDVSVSGFKTSTVLGEIASVTGDVIATSTAGGLRLNANIVAGADISLTGQTFVQQLDRTGLEALEVIKEGSDIQVTLNPVPPTVTVTIADPKAGGTAATARAILGKRFLGNDPGGTDPIWEFYIQRIEIIDAGSGYAISESPIVTITGMPGAVVKAFGPSNDRDITAGGDVVITATTVDIDNVVSLAGGIDVEGATSFKLLQGLGDVNVSGKFKGETIVSTAGNVTASTADEVTSVSAGLAARVTGEKIGSVSAGTDAIVSGGEIGSVEAGTDAIVRGTEIGSVDAGQDARVIGVTISNISAGRDADVTAQTINNVVAGRDVNLENVRDLTVSNVSSSGGDITVRSTSGGITLGGNLHSHNDSVTLVAKAGIVQAGRGITTVTMLSGGSGYTAGTLVTIAPPSAGGTAARGRAIIGTVNGVAGVITGVQILTPGSGYAVGEEVNVTFTGSAGTGASGFAVAGTTPQNILAGDDVTLLAGTGVKILNAVNATNGDIEIRTINGNLDFNSTEAVLSAENGGVTLSSFNGSILSPPVLHVDGDIVMEAFRAIAVVNQLTSDSGSIRVASSSGSLALNANVFAAERVELVAKTGISQTGGFVKADTLRLTNTTPTAITLGSSTNDIARLSAINVGNVTYNDANEFEVGIERNPAVAQKVEVKGDAVSLSSVARGSTIRVVAGIDYRTLSIAAGTLGGSNIGMVEFVTTSTTDNPNAAFRGTLRDMIRLASNNRATFLSDGATIPQPMMMVFDEAGYVVSEINVTRALPAFTKPVIFDGSRVDPSVATGRLGIRGSATALTGLILDAGSRGSTVTDTALYGFTGGSALVVRSQNNAVTNTFFGMKADQTSTLAQQNAIGINIVGGAATGNVIGSSVFDTDTANRFARNTNAGIMIQGRASGNRVVGNVIGLSGSGNGHGIRIVDAVNNQIGMTGQMTPDDQLTTSNLIQFNTGSGISIENSKPGAWAAANRIENNLISSNATTAATNGITISGSRFVTVGGDSLDAANEIHSQNAAGSGVGIVGSTDVAIRGNFIGTNREVSANLANSRHGIDVTGSSKAVSIDGNRIAANKLSGISVGTGVTGVNVTNNEIGGLLSDGTTSAGNKQHGVAITGSLGNTVGAGNRISRNSQSGVAITNAVAATMAAGNRVFGSEIFANLHHGVLLSGASRTTVGGTTPSDANVITSNLRDGIRVEASATARVEKPTGNLITGNLIGTNVNEDVDATLGNRQGIVINDGVSNVASGNIVINNVKDGVQVRGGAGNVIGGITAAAANFIGYNGRDGVLVSDRLTSSTDAIVGAAATTLQNQIVGNEIVRNVGDGVQVEGSKTVQVVVGQDLTGKAVAGRTNTIADNGGYGVLVSAAQQVGVQGNSIYGNALGAISLAASANQFVGTPPQIDLSYVGSGKNGTTIIEGYVSGDSLQQYSIDVYANPPHDGNTGTLQGYQMRTLVGRMTVTAGQDGRAQFKFTVSSTIKLGDVLTLTATSLRYGAGSTSALSNAVVHRLKQQPTPVAPAPVPPRTTPAPVNPTTRTTSPRPPSRR